MLKGTLLIASIECKLNTMGAREAFLLFWEFDRHVISSGNYVVTSRSTQFTRMMGDRERGMIARESHVFPTSGP